jgi:hypothetical protein
MRVVIGELREEVARLQAENEKLGAEFAQTKEAATFALARFEEGYATTRGWLWLAAQGSYRPQEEGTGWLGGTDAEDDEIAGRVR